MLIQMFGQEIKAKAPLAMRSSVQGLRCANSWLCAFHQMVIDPMLSKATFRKIIPDGGHASEFIAAKERSAALRGCELDRQDRPQKKERQHVEHKGKATMQRNLELRPETKTSSAQDSTRDRPGGSLEIEKEGPKARQQDWDELGGATVLPDGDDGSEEIDRDSEKDGELPEEDDDNPDQESDEALPDDKEEQAIRHDLAGSGIRYEPE